MSSKTCSLGLDFLYIELLLKSLFSSADNLKLPSTADHIEV